MRLMFQKLIRTGLSGAQPDDRNFILTTNILAILFSLINVGTLPGLSLFLPDSLPIFAVQTTVGLLWPAVVLLNARGNFAAARFLFAICTIPHISLLANFGGYDANARYLILPGSNLPFFIHPPRYREWMYLHVGASQAEAELDAEKEKSDQLLLNILPGPIAGRLKRGERRIAEDISSATVLSADLAGFTKLSAERNASQIVEMLDGIFSEFDMLARKYGLEKIKTIGDAYMVAGGVPLLLERHAAAVANMAIEMRDLVGKRADLFGGIQIRIGLHSGPVVAGVIGHHKFAYDLWGDTVNTASRMESHGVPGEIQVSQSVFETLKAESIFRERGAIEIKGKGQMHVHAERLPGDIGERDGEL